MTEFRDLGPRERGLLAETLGYLNLSSGAADPRFERNLDELFRRAAEEHGGRASPHVIVGQWLRDELPSLKGKSAAFRDVEQAAALVELVWGGLLPAYREFHRDLLAHQSEPFLFQPFFVARACQAVLAEGSPWNEADRILPATIRRLNDFIGHRPVAVLRTRQRIEPYEHEWVAPIPLYLRTVGVASGPYSELVAEVLDILNKTDRDLLDRAWFDPELMDELCVDPRAYDFEHPVHKRTNYQFGQWDPHRLDGQGRYRRFVVTQVTLDALASRANVPGSLPREELLFEAAAVLAGAILMASGTSGSGPGAHDSATTLATLLPRIAAYRDEFYDRLLTRMDGPRGDRLRAEAARLKQPFGGARQHLNQHLARLRAAQIEHQRLAILFARMGYSEAGRRQARQVPVASARMVCEITGRLAWAGQRIDRGDMSAAVDAASEAVELLHRAIECGAVVDPWNILGFQGQFSLFPSLENSVRDHRVDELVGLVRSILDLHVRLWGESAAVSDQPSSDRAATGLAAVASWWDQFATLDVSGVEHVSGAEAVESAGQVAAALSAWRGAGEAAGDLAFWRKHVAGFTSPKSYALALAALLDKRDLVASMGLLIQWLSQADSVALVEGDYSFHMLALRWMAEARRGQPHQVSPQDPQHPQPTESWPLVRKFIDFLEANSGEWGAPPAFASARAAKPEADSGEFQLDEAHDSEAAPDEDDDEGNLFRAAYEGVVYRDSTRDGFEGSVLDDGSQPSDYELDLESRRLESRLAFLVTQSRLWKQAAATQLPANLPSATKASAAPSDSIQDDYSQALGGWADRARSLRRGLIELLTQVERFRIPPPTAARDSLVEFDRRRMVKESLLVQIIAACVEMADAARWLSMALSRDRETSTPSDHVWEASTVEILRALSGGDAEEIRRRFPALRAALIEQPLLYLPLGRRGDARRIVAAQDLHRVIGQLLRALPRLGLLRETLELLGSLQEMERNHPVGEGAVTEFDRQFETAMKSMASELVNSSRSWPRDADSPSGEPRQDPLLECMRQLVESLLPYWLAHGSSLRLSVLEQVMDEDRWQPLVEFVQRYGRDLFTPRFLNLGNLRSILHEGVDAYLARLGEEASQSDEAEIRLLAELDTKIPRSQAAAHLRLVLQAIGENYPQFRDFHATTIQSDRGDALYMLMDFLRLKASYQRFAWNLKPLVAVHEVLVCTGCDAAAEVWRRSLAEHTRDAADQCLARYSELCRRYGMRLTSVGDLLAERFVGPLIVDRLRALVRPAVEEARRGEETPSFDLLEKEIQDFTEQPKGSGVEVPQWLAILDEEAEDAVLAVQGKSQADDHWPPIPPVLLTMDEALGQLGAARE